MMNFRISRMMALVFLGVCTGIMMSSFAWTEGSLMGRKQVVLKGETAQVSVDIAGGSIVDFHLYDQNINPLTWNYPEKGDLKPRPMGHFICFDRWGQPSAQELKNGMPFHGEATQIEWQVLSEPAKKDGAVQAEMLCHLPIGGLELKRSLTLSASSPVFTVLEEITNVGKLGRVYNIVQHSTIAPDFLDERVLIDANAWKGFSQTGVMPTPEEPAIYWPKIVFNQNLVDLRQLTDSLEPGVTSFVFPDGAEYGWVTAYNPGKGLLLGYIWKLSEYPWLNIWRHVDKGKPVARGMEFGTTGLHQPFSVLVPKGKIFGQPLYEYIDAGQTIVKSYTAFLSKIPADYKGVQEVKLSGGEIVLKEQGSAGREIRIRMK
jgi:hypothetical protein